MNAYRAAEAVKAKTKWPLAILFILNIVLVAMGLVMLFQIVFELGAASWLDHRRTLIEKELLQAEDTLATRKRQIATEMMSLKLPCLDEARLLDNWNVSAAQCTRSDQKGEMSGNTLLCRCFSAPRP